MTHPHFCNLLTITESPIRAYIVEQLQHPMCLLLLQILLILLVSRMFGRIFARLKQPSVIGEIVAGIFLGVSVFGNVFPRFFHLVFPENSFSHLELLSKLGLALFMFVIGMELDLEELKHKAKTVLILSNTSIIIPFLCGIGLAYFIEPTFAMQGINFNVFALFMGISMSITAFPVLARIVKSRNLNRSPLGTSVLSIAATADVMAWCLLAAIIAIAKAGSFQNAIFTIIGAIVFILGMLLLVRPFVANIIARLRPVHYGDQNIVVIALIILLLSSFIAEMIGIHMLFGAFIAGVIIPQHGTLKPTLSGKIEDISELLFLPIFFAFTGLRLQIGLLNTSALWWMCFIIVMIAMVGKFIGSTIPAKMIGMNWKDSLSIGAFMNTRGLMELVVLNIGYDLGILSPSLFAILVIMAIVTTIVTNPILDLIDYLFRKKISQ